MTITLKHLRYILLLMTCLAAGNAGAITLKFDCLNYDSSDPYCAIAEEQTISIVKGAPANTTKLIFNNFDTFAGNPSIVGIYFDSSRLVPFPVNGPNTDPVIAGSFSIKDWSWEGPTLNDPGWSLTGSYLATPENLPNGGDFTSVVTAKSTANSYNFNEGNSMTFLIKQSINRIEDAILGKNGENFDIGIYVDVDDPNSGSAYRSLVSTVVPVPASVWLFGTALIGFIGFSRRRTI